MLAELAGWMLSWAIMRRGLRGRRRARTTPGSPGFGLTLGRATGRLARHVHRRRPRPREEVRLSAPAACQNVLVLGGIGSGKTTALIEPLLQQLLAQGSGGLIFDVKGDFGARVLDLAAPLGVPIYRVGPGHARFPLLAGLNPELAASFLKSAILLSGVHGADAFWVDSATELLRNTLGVLTALPERYSLEGAYAYLFDAKDREQMDSTIEVRAPALDGARLRTLRAYQRYHESVFSVFDEKVAAGIRASAAQVLSPFTHPELVETFCGPATEIGIEQILQPAVWLVDLPLAQWGLGGKVVYTLIKLRFFNLMQRRPSATGTDSGAPVFFMCDEYQEVVSANKEGLSDVNFWDKSRSSGLIGIVSAQSVSSFYAALPQRALADAILQNFRQKICFRTEDPATLQLITAILGRVLVHRRSHSKGRSGRAFERPQYSCGTASLPQEYELGGARLIRTLQPFEAVALLSLEGASFDDVLITEPLWARKQPAAGTQSASGVH